MTRAGVLAFFDAYVNCRADALAYLKQGYDAENAELAVTESGSQLGQELVACLQQ